MSGRDALSVFGDIDGRFVREAQIGKARPWSRWLTVAACAAVMLMTTWFAVEHWMMPSITAESRTHLCEPSPSSEDDFGLGHRVAVRLRYQGRWYGDYGSFQWRRPDAGPSLGTVHRDVDCAHCDGGAVTNDVGGELFAVAGMDPSCVVLMKYTDGPWRLFFAQDVSAVDGGALFNDIFAVRERTCAVRARTIREALDDVYPTRMLSVDDPVTERFLAVLGEAVPTEHLQSKAPEVYDMTLYLDNGVCVNIGLKRGGYIRWRGVNLAVDKAALDAVMAALDAQTE